MDTGIMLSKIMVRVLKDRDITTAVKMSYSKSKELAKYATITSEKGSLVVFGGNKKPLGVITDIGDLNADHLNNIDSFTLKNPKQCARNYWEIEVWIGESITHENDSAD